MGARWKFFLVLVFPNYQGFCSGLLPEEPDGPIIKNPSVDVRMGHFIGLYWR